MGSGATSLSTLDTLAVTISTSALLSTGSTIKFPNLDGAKFVDSSTTVNHVLIDDSLSFVNATVVQNTLQMTVLGNIEPLSLYIFDFNVSSH